MKLGLVTYNLAPKWDVPTLIKNWADKVNSRHDGKKYYFVRSMDLAATYRKWQGLPIE